MLPASAVALASALALGGAAGIARAEPGAGAAGAEHPYESVLDELTGLLHDEEVLAELHKRHDRDQLRELYDLVPGRLVLEESIENPRSGSFDWSRSPSGRPRLHVETRAQLELFVDEGVPRVQLRRGWIFGERTAIPLEPGKIEHWFAQRSWGKGIARKLEQRRRQRAIGILESEFPVGAKRSLQEPIIRSELRVERIRARRASFLGPDDYESARRTVNERRREAVQGLIGRTMLGL